LRESKSGQNVLTDVGHLQPHVVVALDDSPGIVETGKERVGEDHRP